MTPLRYPPLVVVASAAALLFAATQCTDEHRVQPKVPETTSTETPGPVSQPPPNTGELPRRSDPPAPNGETPPIVPRPITPSPINPPPP
ncbi:hypothetical protein [Pendulispora albinea]|uniref:Uncharacterized protein n=1 Tax=Pendulispora albinea TaxID=2741071 RepID=A0ABZ2LTB5_9BACT